MADRQGIASQTTTGAAAVDARRPGIVERVSPVLFYGWIVVVIGFICQIYTSLSIQGLSTYIVPLNRDLGWSATATAAGRSFQQVDTFLGPVNGWLVDKFGPHKLMSVGVVIYVASFVLFSQVTELWHFYVACILMALGNSFVGLLVVSFSLNRWFRRKRSTAIGLAVVGFAASAAIFIPLVVWAQAEYGWREAAFWTAVVMAVLGVPIVLLMRDAPEPFGLLPDGEKPTTGEPARAGQQRGGGLVNFTLRESLRTRTFWLIAVASALAMLVQSAIVVHQFPYFEQVLDRETAALILSVMNIFNIGGRIIGGMLGDRLQINKLMALNMVASSLSLYLLAFGVTLTPFLIYGAVFGFCWGVRAAVSNSILGDYFGRAAFGRIAGLNQTLGSPGSVVSPLLVGIAVDRLGGFEIPFLILATISLCGSALYFVAVRPPTPRAASASTPA
ncbi:MAG: MFS transporter [Chloroflexi bacterium]|nr:MFS transporter [Chloroflexota bacterium]